MVKLSEDVAQALAACDGEPLPVEVPGSDRHYMLVERDTLEAALAAMELQRNVEAIKEGLADLEAGRTMPLDVAVERIRQELGFAIRS